MGANLAFWVSSNYKTDFFTEYDFDSFAGQMKALTGEMYATFMLVLMILIVTSNFPFLTLKPKPLRFTLNQRYS